MKVITLTWSSSSVSIDGLSRLMALMKTKRLVSSARDNSSSRGAGTLNVTGNNRHAVRSDDYIRLRNSVKMNITANGEDGINGKDYLIVDGGTHTINVSASKGKGLKSDTILIAGGSTNITCTGSSAEGIEADYLTIDDGVIECFAKDDGINAAYSIVINGGVIVAVGAQTPEDGIDCDQNNFTITGVSFSASAVAAVYPPQAPARSRLSSMGHPVRQISVFRCWMATATSFFLTYPKLRSTR